MVRCSAVSKSPEAQSDVSQHFWHLYTVSRISVNYDWTKKKMSHLVRKSTFCICENKVADQLCGNRTTDQHLYFRYTDSTIPLLPESKNFKPLAISSSCTAWFVSDPVRNHIVGFLMLRHKWCAPYKNIQIRMGTHQVGLVFSMPLLGSLACKALASCIWTAKKLISRGKCQGWSMT